MNAALLDVLSLKVALSLNHAGLALNGSLSAGVEVLTRALLVPAAGPRTAVSVTAALLALPFLKAVAMLRLQKLLMEKLVNFHTQVKMKMMCMRLLWMLCWQSREPC
jgi:hypothetical protein